ncbi:MAG TPA: protein kinase [Holophaga sp.]|nr:protein kinase [Holophaga sp.]HPS68198.1 protein kinase [Holophaga sp.]
MISKLGRFEIKDLLGRGAMGEVYLGLDPVLGREVAIKTIISSALPEDLARQRFYREAKAAAVLSSPHIVTIHELGEDQGVLFIAMELLKGRDLEQLVQRRSLSLVDFLEVLAQVCDGLDTAHRHHILHRDIKPSNIMVVQEGRKLLAKIMDFGVARLKDSVMTVAGTVMGTVNYIAPEYIKNGEPDARSDLFAVGVMLYECISGKKPFDDASASTVLYKIVHDPPDPLELSMLQGLSPALRNMTEKALAKDPDDRFQSAEEFALALRAAQRPGWNGRLEETTLRLRSQPQPETETAGAPFLDPGATSPLPANPQAVPRSRYTTQQVVVAPPSGNEACASQEEMAAKAGTQEIVLADPELPPAEAGDEDPVQTLKPEIDVPEPPALPDEGEDSPCIPESPAAGALLDPDAETIHPAEAPGLPGAREVVAPKPSSRRWGGLAIILAALGIVGGICYLALRPRAVPPPSSPPGPAAVPAPESPAPPEARVPAAPAEAPRPAPAAGRPKPAAPRSKAPAAAPPPPPKQDAKAAPAAVPPPAPAPAPVPPVKPSIAAQAPSPKDKQEHTVTEDLKRQR